MDTERLAWLRLIAAGTDAGVLGLTWVAVVRSRAAAGGALGMPALEAPAIMPLGWLVVGLWVAVLAGRGRYRTGRAASAADVLSGVGFAVLGVLLLLFLAHIELNRTLLVGFALASVPALWVADRGLLAWVRALLMRWRPVRLALVGRPSDRLALREALARDPGGHVQLVVEVAPAEAGTLAARLEEHPVDEVIVAGTVPPRSLDAVASTCELLGLPLSVDATYLGPEAGHVQLRDVAGWTALTFTPRSEASPSRLAKRAIDVVGALVGLLVGGIPLLLLMWLVRLQDGGPALFVQERLGRHGRPFRMLKLRSMVPEAPQLRAALSDRNELVGPPFKIAHDPRVTRLGAWLRRTSLDELPQLINVLRGEMSLVGPRPPLADEVERYERWQRRRLSVRPGMTGLSQVSGRADLSWERWMALDLRYIDEWSLGLDLVVLIRTVPAVLSGTGAR
ncbi:MAG: exopolysaccharide biosynthesis polyprenyl glycosylphosphotransferase [Myxococcales bacterium]|nr:exopolysaccharide biosynthesis polyprenyl glycosylphosphotransferase [Myxococcales bacterium]